MVTMGMVVVVVVSDAVIHAEKELSGRDDR
jgi:hypothetical protein